MNEWGIFNDESADWTAEEAVEAGYYSREEAEAALHERYADDDCQTHEIEEPEDEEPEDEEDSESYPIQY